MTVLNQSEEYLVCDMKLESPDQTTDCDGWKVFTVNDSKIVVYLRPITTLVTRELTILSGGNQFTMPKLDPLETAAPSVKEMQKQMQADLTPPDDPNWGKPPVEREPKLKPPAPKLPRMPGSFVPAPPVNSDGTISGGRDAAINY